MDAESSVKLLENVTVGLRAKIERKRTGKILEGSIIEILDEQPFNKDGIEVKISGNYSGNVKQILKKSDLVSASEILEKIQKHEKKDFELKSSFKYDIKESNRLKRHTSNEALRRKIAEETASFMNTDGGIICIGVSNKRDILGLENDYRLQKDFEQNQNDPALLQDQLRLEIKQTLKNYLDDEAILGLYEIEFVSLDDKDVCCIIIKKSPEPVFVKMAVTVKVDKKEKKETLWKCWIRVDNGIESIKFDAFMKYWKCGER